MELFSERQQQIIDASIELIAEKSIQALTIKNIAGKIKLTEGAIYRHFSSKNEILLGILQIFQQKAQKTLTESCNRISVKPAFDKIEDIFTHHVRYFSEHPAVTAVIFSESIFQNDTRLSKEVFKLLQMHEQALSCIIEKGQGRHEIRDDIDEKEIIRVILGAMRYTVTKWRLSGYDFDLKVECTLILTSLKKILATP